MKADNDNASAASKMPFKTLDALPLFASDKEIAVAIVGRKSAERWIREVLPTLRGFPQHDSRHGGRPVLLVAKFYDRYFGLAEDFSAAGASGEENLDVWTSKRRRAVGRKT